LNKTREALGHVAQHDLPATILEKAIERRGLFVGVDGVADVGHPTGSSIEEGDFISGDIPKEKPASE
jgi:hypothetical protein